MSGRIFQRVATQLRQGARLAHDAAAHAEHVKTSKMWKLATIFGVPPALIATYYNAFYVEPHHQRPEYKEYEHLRIRSKPFPWGDGNHGLFHNPEMNAVPGVGYEKDPEHGHDH